MGDEERHPRDDAPVRRPSEGFKDPDVGSATATVDSGGRFRGGTVNPADKGDLKYEGAGTKTGPTTNYPNPQVKVDANRVFNLEPSGDLESSDQVPAEVRENTAALGFLRQELDLLEHAATTEDIVRQITSVYTMANNVVRGSEEWDAGLGAEFAAWVPYEVASGAHTEYWVARDAIRQAGRAVYEAANAWWGGNPTKRITSATDVQLAQPLVEAGAELRGLIDTAHWAVKEANDSALQQLQQSIHDLAGASDSETIVRYAATVFAMVSHLLDGDSGGGALDEEVREWTNLTPTDAAVAAKEPLVAAAQAFCDSASQMAQWYPYYALLGWADAPLGELLQAGHTARTAIASP